MFKPTLSPRDIAERYNRFMPDEIRQYLKGRGIPSTLIDRQLLGWDGKRINIPIFGGSTADVRGFRYARLPENSSEAPEMTSDSGDKPELYGWETLARTPHRIVICEGEFDRLVLEARGFPAVTSTAGAKTFLPEWTPFFDGIADVFICFRRSVSSDQAAKKVQRLMPRARVAKLPAGVGQNGSVADYFVGLLRTGREFEVLLSGGVAAVNDPTNRSPQVKASRSADKSQQRRAERIRNRVALYDVVFQFTRLQASGGRLVGHCPFHDDASPSFSVYPETDTYRCAVCGAEGDVVMFLMNKESMTFGQALEALERFEITHEFYGNS